MHTVTLKTWADEIPDADAELLARYARHRDEVAFAVLVRRYGPMILGVCARNAGQPQDAEDAFQAVFLLLAQKAEHLKHPERLSGWLHGVAVRLARKARRAALRRRNHEAKVVTMSRTETSNTDWSDLAPILDDELRQLSDDHGAAILLCDVQGLSRTEAAQRLQIPEGTLSSRLNAARKKLAERLAKRGVTLSAGLLATNAMAAVPDELATSLLTALAHFHAEGVLPAPVAKLLTEGIFSMRSKLVLLMAALSVGSVGVLTAWPGEEPKPQAKAKAESPKAEPPQPEAPKEDFGRLPRDKRAKLLETVESGLSENSTLPLWLEGGKKLLLVSEYEKNSGGNLGPYGGVKQVQVISGFSSLRFLGTIDDGKKWLGYERIGSGVNSVSRLRTWDFRDPTNPYSTAIRTVEFDYEADGVPDAVTPDGKIVYTIKAFVEKPGTINKNAKYGFFFRALDANTGEPIRTIARIERDDFYLTHAFSPKRDRLYVMLLHNKENVLCRCIDPSTGKLVWERTFDGKLQWLQPNRVTPPLFTADGQTVVLNAPYTSELPPAPPRKVPGPPGMRIGDPGSTRPFLSAKFHLIDSTTGKDRVEIALRKDVMNEVIAISPDGRLLAGTVTEPKQPDADGPPPSQLVVWDSRTGQALKRWELGGSRALFVTFAPNRPLMLLWQMGDDRGAKNTLGLWDLSGLLK